MSGHIPTQLAQAAGHHALIAETKAKGLQHPGQLIAQRLQAQLKARPQSMNETTGAAVWRRMDLVVRTIAVMTTSDDPGDPRVVALKSWEAFSDREKNALGAFLRNMHRETAGAVALR